MIDPAAAADMIAALRRLGLAGEREAPVLVPLSGGVSSDIWRAETASGVWCLKRALPKLKVRQEWLAPVERSRHEFDWIATVGAICPAAVPRLAGYDNASGAFAMAFLPPEHYPVWKSELAAGHVVPSFAGKVGEVLGRIHAVTSADAELPARFDTGDIFHAIRLEPYLVATARAHPELAERLQGIAQATASTRRALVHGDVSPKNILCGPGGPVFLDAECAWWGDPAFDLAFCLNHLLLKCIWVPRRAEALRASFITLCESYLPQVNWEPPTDLEARAAALLPALTLARIDGKSPVEYITAEVDKARVRRLVISLITAPATRLADIAHHWWADWPLETAP